MNKQNTNRLRNTENILTITRWDGVTGLGERGERIKKY